MAEKTPVDKVNKVEIVNPEEFSEEKVLFEWLAAERPFQRRDRDFWITAIALLALVSIILVFIKEFFLVIALCSILFLGYVLSTVPPEKIKYKITSRGIYFGEFRYYWDHLVRFWFRKSLSSRTLVIETSLKFPRQLTLVINPENEEALKSVILKKIPFFESSPTFVDKLTKWFADRLPLEKQEKSA